MENASPAFSKRVTLYDSYNFAVYCLWALPKAITTDGDDPSERRSRRDARAALPSVRFGLRMNAPTCRRVASLLPMGNVQHHL